MHIKFTSKALSQPFQGPDDASIRLHRLRRSQQWASAPAIIATLQQTGAVTDVPLQAGGTTVVPQYQLPAARVARGQAHFRTARMLLVLSSLTVLLNLPTHVFRVQAVIHHVQAVFPHHQGWRMSKGKS